MSGKTALRSTMNFMSSVKPTKGDKLVFVGKIDSFGESCIRKGFNVTEIDDLDALWKYRNQDYTFIFFGIIQDPFFVWNGKKIDLNDYAEEKGWYFCSRNLLDENPRPRLGAAPPPCENPTSQVEFASLTKFQSDRAQAPVSKTVVCERKHSDLSAYQRTKCDTLFSGEPGISPNRQPTLEHLLVTVREENAGLQRSLRFVEQEAETLRRENADLKARLGESTRNEERLCAINDEMEAHISALSHSGKGSEASVLELQSQLEQTMRELDEARKAVSSQRRLTETANNTADRLRARNDELYRELERLEQQKAIEDSKNQAKIYDLSETVKSLRTDLKLARLELSRQREIIDLRVAEMTGLKPGYTGKEPSRILADGPACIWGRSSDDSSGSFDPETWHGKEQPVKIPNDDTLDKSFDPETIRLDPSASPLDGDLHVGIVDHAVLGGDGRGSFDPESALPVSVVSPRNTSGDGSSAVKWVSKAIACALGVFDAEDVVPRELAPPLEGSIVSGEVPPPIRCDTGPEFRSGQVCDPDAAFSTLFPGHP